MTAWRPASWLFAAVLIVGLAGGSLGVATAATATPAKSPAPKPTATAKPAVKPSAAPSAKPAAKPAVADPAAQLFQKGAQAYARNQMLAATESFQKVVVMQPGNADAYYYLGLSYYGLGQHDLALAAFTEAKTLYPAAKGEVAFGMGLAHYALGQLSEARDQFAAVGATPAAAELKSNASTWLQVLDGVLAQRSFEQSLAQDTSFREGIERYEQGRFLDAAKAFDTTLGRYPRSGTVFYYLGACHYQLNRFDDAIKAFQSVVQFDPGSQQAKDAQLFIDSIRGRQTSKAGRPFSFFASLGSGYDSNVSYSPTTKGIADATSQLQLTAAYRFSPNLRAQYGLWAGTNLGAVPGTYAGLTSRDFNMLGHTGSVLFDWPVSRFLALAGDYQFSWYFLANQSFLVAHRVTPRLQMAWTPNLASSVYGMVESAQYPTVTERSSINGGVGVTTVWQPPAIPSLVFSGGYDLTNVAAADDAITERLAKLEDGTPYAIRSRLAYSYLSHGPYLAMDWRLWQTSVRLTSRFSWLNFSKPDIYQLSYFQNDRALAPSLETIKLRSDQLLQFSLDVQQPLWESLSLILQASYALNASNITDADYSDRSYSKGLLLATLVYAF